MRTSAFVAFLMLWSVAPIAAQDLAVGQPAPDFSLTYATRDSVSRTPLKLSEIIGRSNIVLAFYPSDWSPGCTKEVCTMRDDFAGLQSLNAEVLAISGDYVWSHHEWAKHHNLPFKLLSDHSHEVAKRYNSYNEKTMYNKRTVFVIDKQGKLAYIDLEYSVATIDDFNRLKEALAQLR
ncbi:MAG TPA: peroxiredoxin [Bacteroidota bacterium]|nr:peroxiredoxin [Bacteroidota bacterium]